jgi:hypothetical protein
MARTTGRRCLMVGVVLATVGVTATVTRSLVPAYSSEQQQGERPGGLTSTTTDQRVVDPLQLPQVAGQVPPNLVRAAKMAAMGVELRGQDVVVSGKVEIYDSVPGAKYIWLLRVYRNDPRKELLREHHYAEQASTLAAGSVSMEPVFLDAIDLPPGSYRVELSNYAVPPNFPLNQVKFGENMKTRALSNVAAARRVDIPG